MNKPDCLYFVMLTFGLISLTCYCPGRATDVYFWKSTCCKVNAGTHIIIRLYAKFGEENDHLKHRMIINRY